jgi:hypothetical protein
VIGPGELVGNSVLAADAVEDVAAEESLDLWIGATVLGQVGKGHASGSGPGQAVAGQDGMDPIREDLDHLA